MTGTLLLQSALAGITNGFVYALVGLGIAVVFRGTRIINAMQGEFALIGGMVAYLVLERLGLPLPLAASGRGRSPAERWAGSSNCCWCGPLAAAAAARRAICCSRWASRSRSRLACSTSSAATPAAAARHRRRGQQIFFDAAIRIHAHLADGRSPSRSCWLLRLFYNRTLIGLSMMAASIDEDGAATIGINVPRMRSLTFLLGGLVGGLAGVLVSPLITIHYEMGLLLTLKGFAAAILGGLTNPFGAVVGGRHAGHRGVARGALGVFRLQGRDRDDDPDRDHDRACRNGMLGKRRPQGGG